MQRDELGPEAVIDVYDPRSGMRGVLVIDNSLCGPCGGGTRMAPDVTVDEVAALARGMTYKFSSFDFPRGGSKAGIIADPNMEPERRRDILREFGRALKRYLAARDVAIGPDMGVTVEDVSTIYEGAGVPDVRTGLFSKPVDEDPAGYHLTGFGVACAVRSALDTLGTSIKGASVAVEGFGQVGVGTARYCHQWGARVVAVTTIRGGLFAPDGLDIPQLLALRRQHGDACILHYEGPAERLIPADLYYMEVDVLVPGARPYVINAHNAARVRAKVISPAANIAVTEAAEQVLFDRGIQCLPDYIVNAGGALASWVDILGGEPQQAFTVLDRQISPRIADILDQSRRTRRNPCDISRTHLWQKLLNRTRRRPSFDESRVEIKGLLGL